MVKKEKTPDAVRWRQARLAVRLHDDLREAVEFCASLENRATSNFIETCLIAIVRQRLENQFSEAGERLDRGVHGRGGVPLTARGAIGRSPLGSDFFHRQREAIQDWEHARPYSDGPEVNRRTRNKVRPKTK
jgi:hypothetical protein